MKIIKYPNKKHHSSTIHFKSKCPCGLKVCFESLTDIVYQFGIDYPTFGYYCPNCNEFNVFGDIRNSLITHRIKKICSIRSYALVCENVRDFINFADVCTTIGSQDYQMSVDWLKLYELPLPSELYKKEHNIISRGTVI